MIKQVNLLGVEKYKSGGGGKGVELRTFHNIEMVIEKLNAGDIQNLIANIGDILMKIGFIQDRKAGTYRIKQLLSHLLLLSHTKSQSRPRISGNKQGDNQQNGQKTF